MVHLQASRVCASAVAAVLLLGLQSLSATAPANPSDLEGLAQGTGAIVSGNVVNGSGTPQSGALVGAYDLAGNRLAFAYTDASGNYTVSAVPVGGAKIRFSMTGYALEWYNDQPTFGTGATLNTQAGIEIPNTNAVLTAGGTISGTIRDVNGTGQQVNMLLYSALDSTYYRDIVTSAEDTGVYSFTSVKPGDYKILAVSTEGDFGPEWYNNATSFAAAGTVTVTEGGTASGRNIVMGARRGLDFNTDLRADVLWRHVTNGEVWAWLMNGAVPQSQSRIQTVVDLNWEIRAVADFDGDVDPDIVWRNKITGEVWLWTMQGTALTAQTPVATVNVAYDIESYGDYSADGQADLAWRNTTSGELWIWELDGATIESVSYLATVAPEYRVRLSADFNGDGMCDALWHNSTTGEVWVWLAQEGADPARTFVAAVPNLSYQIKAAGDFDGDGRADIVWHNGTTGEVWVWRMNGGTLTAATFVAAVPNTDYRIVSAGDYDGDLRADLLWWNSSNGEVWIWSMNGATLLSADFVGSVPDTGYRIVR